MVTLMKAMTKKVLKQREVVKEAITKLTAEFSIKTMKGRRQ